MKDFAKIFYSSDAWHKCRLSYIAHRQSVDGGMCECCHEQPGYIVHHKVHLTPGNIGDPAVTLAWSNLEYVCKACHDKLHDYCEREKPRNRKIVFINGEPRELTPP